MLIAAATETVSIGAVIGLLSGALTLLAAIFRYLRKGWVIVATVVEKIDFATAEVKALKEKQVVLEAKVNQMILYGTGPTRDTKRKVEQIQQDLPGQ